MTEQQTTAQTKDAADAPQQLPASPPPPHLGPSYWTWGPNIFFMVGGFY